MAKLPKRTVPYGPGLKTRPERIRAAKELKQEPDDWLDTLLRAQKALGKISQCIGSKRKNLKGIECSKIAQVHFSGGFPSTYLIVELFDGRMVYISGTEVIVSHDLENLWWYGVPEVVRKVMTYA